MLWIASVYEKTEFDEQPFLKSASLLYKRYLENMYNLNNQCKENMNNELDKTISEMLKLDSISLTEKIKVIEDQIVNIDKMRDRYFYMLKEYKKKV